VAGVRDRREAGVGQDRAVRVRLRQQPVPGRQMRRQVTVEREGFSRAILIAATLAFSAAALAQSPPARATAMIGGQTVQVQYSAPSVRGRKIFGDDGLLSRDPTYPIWRAGANAATTFKTEGPLDVAGLTVPGGTYTIYVNVKDPAQWELVVSKATGQWGL